MPVFYTLPDFPLTDNEETQDMGCNTTEDSSLSDYEENISTSRPFTQVELNLLRDLNLSKHASELLASRLKEKNGLKPEAKISDF